MPNASPSTNCCAACRALIGQPSEQTPHPHLTATLGKDEGEQFICRECGTALSRVSTDQAASGHWGVSGEVGSQRAVVEAKASANDATTPATADEVQSVAVNPANAD